MSAETPNKNEQGGGFREVQKEFKEELLRIDRVTRVTAGGRQLRFRASVVIGNGKGTVGLGIGKANEVVVAIDKAIRDAKKNLISFPIQNGSVPHELVSSYKAASVFIHPASEGTGIIAGGSVRKILAVSGVKDVLAKLQSGTKNPITNARAIMKALGSLKGAKQVIASDKMRNESNERRDDRKGGPRKGGPRKPGAPRRDAAPKAE